MAVFNLIRNNSANIDFLWERAVLSKGDYLICATANRRNMLSTRSGKARNATRDYNWKRLLLLVVPNASNRDIGLQRQKYAKEVFDDPSFDVNTPKESLQTICNCALNEDISSLAKIYS